MTARIEGRTAIVSRISVRRAPIAVVIALSACGRFSVTTATRSSCAYSTSTGWSGSSRPDGGGPKSSAFQRSVRVGLVTTFCRLPISAVPRVQLRQPAQRAETRSEAVLPAAGDHERRQALQPAADRSLGDGEGARSVICSGERVFLGRRADKDAVVLPLRLDELKLALGIGTGEDEDDAAVRAVVLQDPVRQDRAIARSESEHAVQADIDAHLMIERVPGVRTPGMRADGTSESAQIIAVAEAVVTAWVRAEIGIV